MHNFCFCTYLGSKGYFYASKLKGFKDTSTSSSAFLYSPILSNCSLGGSVSFAYYLSSSKTSLTVKIMLYKDEKSIDQVTLWSSNYEQNKTYESWIIKNVHLERRKIQFKIGFLAEINLNNNNSLIDFVAIDEIDVLSCQPPKRSPQCNGNNWHTFVSRKCI